MTQDPAPRMRAHRAAWMWGVARAEFVAYPTRAEAAGEEARAIREEGPLHNAAHNGGAYKTPSLTPEEAAAARENFRRIAEAEMARRERRKKRCL